MFFINNFKKFFIPIVFLIYVIYKSEIYWSGTERYYYITYYIIIAFLFIINYVYFLLNKNFKQFFLIISISTFISFYAFEFFLISKNLIYQSKNYFAYYLSKNKNDSHVISFSISNNPNDKKNNLLPLAGISNKLTILPNENDFFPIYKSDMYGFNNQNNKWGGRGVDFVFIGDSFVQGYSVKREHNIPESFQQLSRNKVLNLGFAGNGMLRNLAVMREYLPENYKNIIYIHCEGNDTYETLQEYENLDLRKYLNKNFTQNLKTKQSEIDLLLQNYLNSNVKKGIERYKKDQTYLYILINFLKLKNTRTILNKYLPTKYQPANPFRYDIDYGKAELIYNKTFKEILSLVDKKKSQKIYFVYFPAFSSIKNGNYINKEFKTLQKVLSNNEIKILNIGEVFFKNEQNPLSYYSNKSSLNHYNKDAYKKIASKIYEFIRQDNN